MKTKKEQENKDKIVFLNYSKKEKAIKEIEQEQQEKQINREAEQILRELNIRQEIK